MNDPRENLRLTDDLDWSATVAESERAELEALWATVSESLPRPKPSAPLQQKLLDSIPSRTRRLREFLLPWQAAAAAAVLIAPILWGSRATWSLPPLPTANDTNTVELRWDDGLGPQLAYLRWRIYWTEDRWRGSPTTVLDNKIAELSRKIKRLELTNGL